MSASEHVEVLREIRAGYAVGPCTIQHDKVSALDAAIAALSADPEEGCGACPDSCKTLYGCQLAHDSPPAPAEPVGDAELDRIADALLTDPDEDGHLAVYGAACALHELSADRRLAQPQRQESNIGVGVDASEDGMHVTVVHREGLLDTVIYSENHSWPQRQELETPRRMAAVQTLLDAGWKWNGERWVQPQRQGEAEIGLGDLPDLPPPTSFLVCKGSEVTARAWNVDEMRAFAKAAIAMHGGPEPLAFREIRQWMEHCVSAAEEGVEYSCPREVLDALTAFRLMEKCGRGKWRPTEAGEKLAARDTQQPASQGRSIPDLDNWATHYSISPTALAALQCLLSLQPASAAVAVPMSEWEEVISLLQEADIVCGEWMDMHREYVGAADHARWGYFPGVEELRERIKVLAAAPEAKESQP